MKLTPYRISLVLIMALAGSSGAVAQTNGVPGPEDYKMFSHFIADRNIFDPNREPHSGTHIRRTPRPTKTHNISLPSVQLVGTMSYDKGLFAFFNGNDSELKKILQVGDKIAGYSVTDIARNEVHLESADNKGQLTLYVGDGLRQEDGKWVPATADSLAIQTSSSSTSTESPENDSPSTTPAAPASASEPNEILKRLMQLREKESQ